MVKSKICVYFLMVGLVLGFISCAASANREKTLTERVSKYWEHKIKGDFDKSYLYEVPEYRKEVTASDYAKSFGSGVSWLGVRVDRVEVKGNEGIVYVAVRYVWNMVPYMPKDGIKSLAREKWKLVDGRWYHLKIRRTSLLKGGGG